MRKRNRERPVVAPISRAVGIAAVGYPHRRLENLPLLHPRIPHLAPLLALRLSEFLPRLAPLRSDPLDAPRLPFDPLNLALGPTFEALNLALLPLDLALGPLSLPLHPLRPARLLPAAVIATSLLAAAIAAALATAAVAAMLTAAAVAATTT